ncbi:MAG: hypothetical protein A2077_01445 [Nitrospirae bacterium GWC2_46_6]|nr:MAG: hypothetical protein A2077_01445 [Nitrospirae bacterium GWC2_46_6]OGW25811.1 MAG: hypothetical protein A2X55_02765 [Nitrospirae bacterium GWB2_47_37]HAK89011.1 hypothetical protein [Nitrospiraceae bacterium]
MKIYKFLFPSSAFIAVIPVVFVFLGAGYALYLFLGAPFGIEPMNEQELRFQSAIKKVIQSGAESVYIKDLTDFKWDAVRMIGPHMSKEEAEAKIGFKYHDYYKYNWGVEDSHWGLLFVDKGKKRITTVRIPTALAKGAEDCHNCVLRDKAKFIVNRYIDERLGPQVRLVLAEK